MIEKESEVLKDPFEKMLDIIIDIENIEHRRKLLSCLMEIKEHGIRTYLQKEDFTNSYLRWEASRIRKKKSHNRTNSELEILSQAESLGL